METRVLFERKYPDEVLIDESAEVLNHGGIIVIPTDTIPGIGCRVDKLKAIMNLFRLKERPADLPIPVILADSIDIEDFAMDIPNVFKPLADRFWPGALTMILKSNGRIPAKIGGGGKTLGFRVPDYPLLRGLVRKLECPLALTSANPHNYPPTGLHSSLLGWWNHQVELIILGQSTVPRPASAVVNLVDIPPTLLRESTIDHEELMEMLNRKY